MTNRFETMPVGIDDEGGVVGSVVLRPETRRTIVARARGERRFVERIDRGAVGRAKADMAIERGACGLGANPERQALLAQRMFIGQAVARDLVMIVAAAIAERREDRVVEARLRARSRTPSER